MPRPTSRCIVTVLLAVSGLCAGQSTRELEARLAREHGMVIPRPVDAQARKRLGYPAPRTTRVILKDIDELSRRMDALRAENDVWKARFREYRAMQRRRVSLISELEESGYGGARLRELLMTKVGDLDDVIDRWPESTYAALRADIAERHAKTIVGRTARFAIWMQRISSITRAGLKVHPDDYDKIAAFEKECREDETAGVLLLQGLRRSGDAALVERWHDWMIENLAPHTAGYRTVMRKRIFGRPLRLQGSGFAGEVIDTKAWKGKVIVVDFWGTW